MKKYEQLFEKWRKTITEAAYNQRHFQISAVLVFNKNIGGEITEKIREIRAIPNVTTVTNKGTVSENETFYKANYIIKFVIVGSESMDDYVRTVFKPYMEQITGIRLNKIQNIKDITNPERR